jgi:16S rRNA G966 N2-methylase RsmD
LDPFAGSGTVLLESIINPIVKRSSIGVEINPLARLISKVKTTPLNFSKIEQLMQAIQSLYKHAINGKDHIPDFKNRELWFSYNAIKKLAKLKRAIENLDVDSDFKDFFWICFSSIIRKIAKADPYIPPPVVLKPKKYRNNPRKYERLKKFLKETENPNIWEFFKDAVNNNKKKLDILNRFNELKDGKIKLEIIWDDARDIKKGHLTVCGRINKKLAEKVPSNTIDIVFTSPPYLTAQKYIRTNKLELFWLGYSNEEVNYLEKISIGTERIKKDLEYEPLGIKSIDSLTEYVLPKSYERGLMVYKYFKDMLEALKEMHRLLRNNGYAVLVVGDNKVLDKKVDTYRLLVDAAVSIGFTEICILKDTIKSRSMMTKRNSTGGLIKNEYVAILKREA